MKLIIGIGNPGPEYENTKHNIGFAVLDYIAKKEKLGDFEMNKKVEALVLKDKISSSVVVLAKPQTFVNKSGSAVAKLKNFYKVKPENIIIIQDDLDVPFGNTKMSFDRNSGGHRGIDSVIRSLKTKKFYRIRIGLANTGLKKARQESDKKRDQYVVNLVLSKFTKFEQEKVKLAIKEAYEKLQQLL